MATLGNTNSWTGNSAPTIPIGGACAIKVTPSVNASVSTIHVYGAKNASNTHYAWGKIWKESDGSVVATTAGITDLAFISYDLTWDSAAIAYTLDSGVTYWIGVVPHASGDIDVGYNVISADYYRVDETGHSGDSPIAFVPDIVDTRDYSIYITYTEAAPGPSLLVEGITPGKVEGIDWGDIADIT